MARAAMHPQWQDVAARLVDERTAMGACAMLMRDKVDITGAAECAQLNLRVLHQDATTKSVHLGVFEMPPILKDIMDGPKGLPLDARQPWFYLEQRAALRNDFLQAVLGTRPPGLPPYGVLLSGPNGSGKSSIGVEAALACFARGLVCVYIARASEWVAAAKAGHGDAFLLQRLLRQNADLIAAQPLLRKALAPALVLDTEAVGKMDASTAEGLMDALRAAVKANPALKVGIIVDEVQTITFTIRDGMPEAATTAPRIAAEYFLQWHNWDNRNGVFVRMDIASSHGARELKLPSGEEHRLQVIKPWTEDLVDAATTAAGSPCAFPEAYESARKRIIFTAGGIPRSLFRGKQLLEAKLAAYDKMRPKARAAAGPRLPWATSEVEGDLKVAMEENCSRWFKTLSADEKAAASRSMLQLVRGELSWSRVKGLYDDGLVARCEEGSRVKPVSAVASSVIIGELAQHYLDAVRVPLQSINSGAERGFALELQVITCLATIGSKSLPAMTLKGDEAAPSVPVQVDERLPFGGVKDLEAHDSLSRLYIPTSKTFFCDAITMPAASAASSEPIVFWETSVTEPRDYKRLEKVLKWFDAEGIITQVRAAHPERSMVCALCWDEKQEAAAAQARKYVELTAAAAAASAAGVGDVRVAVVDVTGLQALGVAV